MFMAWKKNFPTLLYAPIRKLFGQRNLQNQFAEITTFDWRLVLSRGPPFSLRFTLQLNVNLGFCQL
jgi:hypothetical protein